MSEIEGCGVVKDKGPMWSIWNFDLRWFTIGGKIWSYEFMATVVAFGRFCPALWIITAKGSSISFTIPSGKCLTFTLE